jgi:hypothetical protein
MASSPPNASLPNASAGKQVSAAGQSTSEPFGGDLLEPDARPASPVLGFLGAVARVAIGSPWAVVSLVVLGFSSYFGFLMLNVWAGRLPRAASATSVAVAAADGDTHVRWSKKSARLDKQGQVPQSKALEIDSGFLRLVLSRGATLLIEGPAQWSIDGDNRATLRSGKLVAHVPSQAVGFELQTPQARVIDLGTDFGVSVDAAGNTETHVFRGTIEVEPARSAKVRSSATVSRQRLTAGQVARVSAKAPTEVQVIDSSATDFVRQLPAIRKPTLDTKSSYTSFVLGETKPALYWNFDSIGARNAKDLVHSFSLSSFVPERSDAQGPRASDGFGGMKPDNRALEVSGSGGVTLNELVTKVGVGTQAYSVQLWVNSAVDFHSQPLHYLLGRGNGWKYVVDGRDAVLITGNFAGTGSTGTLCFYDGNGENKDFVIGRTQLLPHQWYQVTLVRDGDQVRVYLNGNVEIDTQMPWRGGEGCCLAAGHRMDLHPGFGLNGRFDEVAVWDRALGGDEILKMARAARMKLSSEQAVRSK